MRAHIKWVENRMFVDESGTGYSIVLGAGGRADSGSRAPSAVELVLIGLGGCPAYDVVHILEKGASRSRTALLSWRRTAPRPSFGVHPHAPMLHRHRPRPRSRQGGAGRAALRRQVLFWLGDDRQQAGNDPSNRGGRQQQGDLGSAPAVRYRGPGSGASGPEALPSRSPAGNSWVSRWPWAARHAPGPTERAALRVLGRPGPEGAPARGASAPWQAWLRHEVAGATNVDITY